MDRCRVSTGRRGCRLNSLTPKQTAILIGIVSGRSVKQIAYENNLSVKTIETHRTNIMDRLKIRHIPGLVVYAIKTGLLQIDQPERMVTQ